VNLNECPNRAVISPFYIIREKTGREFFHAPMILNAFAADSLAAAWLIGAVAFFHSFFNITFFHWGLLKNIFFVKSCSSVIFIRRVLFWQRRKESFRSRLFTGKLLKTRS
jgi:hypothetical protein